MAYSQYSSYDDLEEEITPEERKLLQDAEGMGQFGAATGSAVGTGLGTAAALGLGISGVGAPLAGLAVPAGSALGGWLGGMIGGEQAKSAAEKYEKLRAARMKPLEERQRKMAMLNEMVSPWLNVRGL